ncbi:MAG: SiaB family protein kinase [Bacteroidales bacterium]|nr:SiaB family protein kinase [Bacteroidales bacterium]
MVDVDLFYESLIDEGETIINYKGEYTEDVLQKLLHAVDDIECDERKIRRKLFFISVELLQNIHHHASKIIVDNLPLGYFHFVINRISDKIYKISAANFVNRTKFNTLVSRIEQLNLLSEDEIKHLYKTVLNNNEFSEKGGGGLGMIDIKRKSQQKLEYKHLIFNKNLYFFNFSIFLEHKN